MLRKLVMLVVVLALIGAVAFWYITALQRVAASALAAYTPNLANGKTMFLVGGCASCHAIPKQEDKTRLGGGLGLKSPFGTFFTPNISPDRRDGIGGWSEADFVTAMWKGTAPDGSHYYPAFPYTSYQRMKLEDVRDLFAYLKTLPPVEGKPRDHDLPFYLKIRRLLGGWNFLFLDGQPFKPDPSKSEEWNRGAYLVNGPGHCAECHSPRNVLGAIIAGERFAGGPGGNRRLLAARHRAHLGDGRHAQRRFGGRCHDGGGRQHLEDFGRGPRRHRALPQIIAARRRPETSLRPGRLVQTRHARA